MIYDINKFCVSSLAKDSRGCLPYYCDEEEGGGGEGGHQLKVDQTPPGLEHLEEDLELTGQWVYQDLLLQLILQDCVSQSGEKYEQYLIHLCSGEGHISC